ncbi:class F sortase [Streptacidiphilus neutrinimicus]|uniref:class F sortase n=1 Tax=Streptacidiphilus neutrinimicus TaxID=105420 RepID=UPI0005AA5DFB|nr:class F sortase [Streptacidiphilus neutrinimicus]
MRAAVLTAAVVASATLSSACGGTGGAPAARPTWSATAGGSGPDSPSAAVGQAGAGRAPRPIARSTPVRLVIPSIGVDTALMSLGLASDGTVQVPPIEANAPAGWYRGSPTPGQTGPSVILAHVTVGRYGDGVFLHLSRLGPGDRATVRLQDGASAVFAVDRVQTVAKAQFPTQAVYGNVDRPELRLITCGGPRNPTGGGYLDNVVVYAHLVSTAG